MHNEFKSLLKEELTISDNVEKGKELIFLPTYHALVSFSLDVLPDLFMPTQTSESKQLENK
jgi:hypothetical protein